MPRGGIAEGSIRQTRRGLGSKPWAMKTCAMKTSSTGPLGEIDQIVTPSCLSTASKERTHQTCGRIGRHRIGRSFPPNSRSPFGVRRPVELAPDIFSGTTRDASDISGTSLATDLAPAASFSTTRDAGRHVRKGNPRVLLSAPVILCSV